MGYYGGGGGSFNGGIISNTTTFNDDVQAVWGTGADAAIEWDTAQTPDSWLHGVDQSSRGLIICEKADIDFDFSHSVQTNPTVFIHSANQSTTEWVGITHNQTNGVISTGTGAVQFPGVGANTTQIGSITGNFARSTVVGANATVAAVDQTIIGQGADGNNAAANGATALGSGASCRGSEGTALGKNSSIPLGHAQSVCLGAETTTTAANQFVIGAVGRGIKDWFAPNGVTAATCDALTINGTGGVGTDIVASAVTIASGKGTGASTPTQVLIKAPAQGTGAGTTAQTLVNRVVVNGTKALTSAVAATVVTVTAAAGQMAGGHLIYTVEATDGTDHIAASGQVAFALVNKATTFTGVTSIIGTEAQAKSDGTDTIANTWAFAAGGGSLQITSTVVGLTATTFRITYTIVSNSQQAVVSA